MNEPPRTSDQGTAQLGATDSAAVPTINPSADAVDPAAPADVARDAVDERTRLPAGSMPHKVFIASSDGAVGYVNRQWNSFTGLPIVANDPRFKTNRESSEPVNQAGSY